jgi:hypothetical protein
MQTPWAGCPMVRYEQRKEAARSTPKPVAGRYDPSGPIFTMDSSCGNPNPIRMVARTPTRSDLKNALVSMRRFTWLRSTVTKRVRSMPLTNWDQTARNVIVGVILVQSLALGMKAADALALRAKTT